ncbi:hypothetical protein TIFTF001_011454 [Ficus carica]|uniref:Uncharacterized protein n=1 Tax=Ficus carica TaxID=3494 RepID=A0AA88AE45_FICCA|nr:hypothetical protein TIFTF001_011454 [Ficus carica]
MSSLPFLSLFSSIEDQDNNGVETVTVNWSRFGTGDVRDQAKLQDGGRAALSRFLVVAYCCQLLLSASTASRWEAALSVGCCSVLWCCSSGGDGGPTKLGYLGLV